MNRTAVTGRKPSAKVTMLVNQGTRDSIIAQALDGDDAGGGRDHESGISVARNAGSGEGL